MVDDDARGAGRVLRQEREKLGDNLADLEKLATYIEMEIEVAKANDHNDDDDEETEEEEQARRLKKRISIRFANADDSDGEEE